MEETTVTSLQGPIHDLRKTQYLLNFNSAIGTPSNSAFQKSNWRTAFRDGFCLPGLTYTWHHMAIFPVKSCGVFQLSSGIGCTCAGLFPCLFSLEHWSLRPTGLFPPKSFQPFHCWLFPSQISRLFFPCPFRYLVGSWPARLHPNDSAGMAETNNLEQLTDVRLSSSSYRSLCIFIVEPQQNTLSCPVAAGRAQSADRARSQTWGLHPRTAACLTTIWSLQMLKLSLKYFQPSNFHSLGSWFWIRCPKNMEQGIYCVRPDPSVCNTSKFGSLRVRWLGPVRFFWGVKWCKKIAESFGYLILLLHFLAEGSFKPPWSICDVQGISGANQIPDATETIGPQIKTRPEARNGIYITITTTRWFPLKRFQSCMLGTMKIVGKPVTKECNMGWTGWTIANERLRDEICRMQLGPKASNGTL